MTHSCPRGSVEQWDDIIFGFKFLSYHTFKENIHEGDPDFIHFTMDSKIEFSLLKFLILIYRTVAITTRSFYCFYPIFKDHFFVFNEIFSENSLLVYG